jgi:hypothetical protein
MSAVLLALVGPCGARRGQQRAAQGAGPSQGRPRCAALAHQDRPPTAAAPGQARRRPPSSSRRQAVRQSITQLPCTMNRRMLQARGEAGGSTWTGLHASMWQGSASRARCHASTQQRQQELAWQGPRPCRAPLPALRHRLAQPVPGGLELGAEAVELPRHQVAAGPQAQLGPDVGACRRRHGPRSLKRCQCEAGSRGPAACACKAWSWHARPGH